MMPKIEYIQRRFSPRSLAVIKVADAIISEYKAQGFELTLRQLYYQFISRDVIPNTMKSYKNLGSIINDARLAGYIDWSAIVDRTRELRGVQHWERPEDIVEAAANSFKVDRWEGQEERPELWVEKDALVGVFEKACRSLDVDYFSCRGYTSQSEMWEASQRILRRFNDSQQRTVILHFGDHDPSGIDMTRDIVDRITMFIEKDEDNGVPDANEVFEVRRIALHMEQVKKLKLPPNPAKMKDPRAYDYIERYGHQSWELDALEPKILVGLTNVSVARVVSDLELMRKKEKEEQDGQARIRKSAKRGL
jgi:hypothetical protein